MGLGRGGVSVCEELRGCGMGGFVGSGMGIGFNVNVVVFGVAGVVLGVYDGVLVVLFDVPLVVGLVASGIARAVGLVGDRSCYFARDGGCYIFMLIILRVLLCCL